MPTNYNKHITCEYVTTKVKLSLKQRLKFRLAWVISIVQTPDIVAAIKFAVVPMFLFPVFFKYSFLK